MIFNILNFSLICDKAIDVYSSIFLSNKNYNSRNLHNINKKELFNIIDSIIYDIEQQYNHINSKLIICIDCYPCMRMKDKSKIIVNRYISYNSNFLRKIGLSVDSYLFYVEKYISDKCKYEKNEYNNGKIIFLKNKYTFSEEWKRLFINQFGKTLIKDINKSKYFKNNPNIISSISIDDEYNDLPKDIEYKDNNILKSLI